MTEDATEMPCRSTDSVRGGPYAKLTATFGTRSLTWQTGLNCMQYLMDFATVSIQHLSLLVGSVNVLLWRRHRDATT